MSDIFPVEELLASFCRQLPEGLRNPNATAAIRAHFDLIYRRGFEAGATQAKQDFLAKVDELKQAT